MCLLPLRKINSEDLASSLGFPGDSVVKNPLVMQQTQETLVRFLGLEDPLEESMATTPELLPGESHGQRSLVGYSPWSCKESDSTERLNNKVLLTLGPTITQLHSDTKGNKEEERDLQIVFCSYIQTTCLMSERKLFILQVTLFSAG